MPVAASEFVVYGKARTYAGGCLWNPCYPWYYVIETPAALRKAPTISFGRVNNRGTARCRRPVARYPTVAYVDRAASAQRTDGRCQILLTWR